MKNNGSGQDPHSLQEEEQKANEDKPAAREHVSEAHAKARERELRMGTEKIQ